MLKKRVMILAVLMFLSVISESGVYVIENVHFANHEIQGSENGDVKLANIVSSNAQK